MGAFFGKTRVMRRTEVTTAQDEYSIDDKGPGFDPSARTVLRVDRRGTSNSCSNRPNVHGRAADPSRHPRAEFARMLTSDRQFARATVNLSGGRCSAWASSIRRSRGIWHASIRRIRRRRRGRCNPRIPSCSRHSRSYFIDNNYSLRSVITLIAKSSAYQLSSQFPVSGRRATRRTSRASSCGV